MEEELEHLQNIHVSAIEQNGKVVFLHKIKEGPTDKSYGIHVAKLAELPIELINRANEILASLENQDKNIEEIFQKNTDIVVQKADSFIAQNEKMEQVEEAIINVSTAKRIILLFLKLMKHSYPFLKMKVPKQRKHSITTKEKTCARENKRVRYLRYDTYAGDEYSL